MFKNVWEEIVSWFKNDRYNTEEEIYYLELAKAKLVIEELENIEQVESPNHKVMIGDDDMKDWNKELINAQIEFLKEEPKRYGTNSWTEDSIGRMNFIQNMYQSIRDIKEPEDIVRHLIMKLEEKARFLHDNVDYKEQRGKKIFELEKDLRGEYDKRKTLIHELREYKEERYRDMKEKMSEEQMARLIENREMLYGMFANEDMFKERIFDWIKDCMNTDSTRLVECGSDLAERCQEIADDTTQDMDEDRIWDIAREVMDELDWNDIAYDHDIPNKDEVREIISDDFKEHLDDYIETDKINSVLTETSEKMFKISVQEQVKTALINFLTILKNDLSKKAITDEKDE